MTRLASPVSWFLLAVLGAVLPACSSTPRESETTAPFSPEAQQDGPEFSTDEGIRLIRSTERNVKHHSELMLQGKTQQMVALRRAVGRTVDDNFQTFEDTALKSEWVIHRNMAVKCIGFAVEERERAFQVLAQIAAEEDVTLVNNAALGMGMLRDKNIDLTILIKLLAHGNVDVKTSAATSIREIWLLQETPRELTPEHWTTIDRLLGLLHERRFARARRAAIWAFANLRHPDVLDHLVSALKDEDEYVQIGGLVGLERLGDQRGLEPILVYLEEGPTTSGVSYARKALVAIAVQAGFAKTPSECDVLGDNPRTWRQWIGVKRMG
ncbi:MAG: hypothetical protein OER88_06160 [Planctomycetota bacterium]|nr:hypothetical protein [Planctomycetota bacterium]